MGSSGWKLILLPPLSAFIIYLILTYLLTPLYARLRQRRHVDALPSFIRYAPLGSSSVPTQTFQDFAARVSALIGRQESGSNAGEGFLGDEELEEGNLLHTTLGDSRPGDRGQHAMDGETTGIGRRLSRELESGFMDDSDEEEGSGTKQLG